jgi:hypothetical protein
MVAIIIDPVSQERVGFCVFRKREMDFVEYKVLAARCN